MKYKVIHKNLQQGPDKYIDFIVGVFDTRKEAQKALDERVDEIIEEMVCYGDVEADTFDKVSKSHYVIHTDFCKVQEILIDEEE